MNKKTNKPINTGVAGCGRAGWGMHKEELKAHGEKFKVVAACDTDPARRDMMADKYGCTTYSRIEELIADPAVELVDIATRSPDHAAHAIMALQAGKKVFLEKPIALSLAEAKKLAKVAAKYPDALFIRHNRRFEPGFQHIREIIDSGLLGEVYEIKLRRQGFGRRDDWQTILKCGGGQLLNWGPHLVDHALQFLGGKVDSIWSDLRRIAAAGDAEDHVHIILKGGKNSLVVDLEISGGVALSEPVYTVFGSKGALSSNEKTIKLRHLKPGATLSKRKSREGTPELGTFGSPDKLFWVEKEIPVKPKARCNCGDIWAHLHATIRQGKPFPIKLSEAVQVMEVISKARRGTPYEQL